MGALGHRINLVRPVAEIPPLIAAYRAACPPGFAGHVGYLRNVYIRPTSIDPNRPHRAARRYAELLSGQSPPNPETATLCHDFFGLYGSQTEAADQINHLKTLGVDELICSLQWGDITYAEAETTLDTLAQFTLN